MKNHITVKGARHHNLKNITVKIPKNKFNCLCGVSGSGKSTLAYDVIYSEGHRRYVESLSAYARQFLGMMEKPDVDSIEGLTPVISIEQKTVSRNPRSTVGTITEIYDYMRVLYARAGRVFCPECGVELVSSTVQEIVDSVMSFPEGEKIYVIAPLIEGRKGEHKNIINEFLKQGYMRFIIDGNETTETEKIKLNPKIKHTVYCVIDRLKVSPSIKDRLTSSVEHAVHSVAGKVYIKSFPDEKFVKYSTVYSCMKCSFSLSELEPRLFSFNSPYGACADCGGLGDVMEMDEDSVVPDKTVPVIYAFKPFKGEGYIIRAVIKAIASRFGFSPHQAYGTLTEEQKKVLLYGTKDNIEVEYSSQKFKGKMNQKFEGVLNLLMRRFQNTESEYAKKFYMSFLKNKPCPSCGGMRLKKEALFVKIKNKNISELCSLSVIDTHKFFEGIIKNLKNEDAEKQKIYKTLLSEITRRIDFLRNVGLGYLTLSRSSATLSGGEAQRIRLASQLGSKLVGVCYILDEPSIGLHKRDNGKLLKTLHYLKEEGNTLIVIEHDEDTILAADFIVELGPGAGVKGGEVVTADSRAKFLKSKNLTSLYLSGKKTVHKRKQKKYDLKNSIILKGAKKHNLKNIEVKFPLNSFICVTGVSGSGKSTLVNETLIPLLREKLENKKNYDDIGGIKNYSKLSKIIEVDQSPIGRTPRSNPATYTGFFNLIRDLYSKLPESRLRGYKPGRFSFNVHGGRCERCQGAGQLQVQMHFLPDIYVVCPDCGGKRFNRDTLEVKYKGKSIYDTLDMTINQALEFFENIPGIKRKLQTLADVGLGYVKLGQPATTLSGGEAQRIKLASELSKKTKGKTLYVLDEPTTGLHFADIDKLLKVLDKLVEKGNTIIVIEHNVDIIENADYIIDLGPEGGDAGGKVIGEGSPSQIAQSSTTATADVLRAHLRLPVKRTKGK